MGSRKEIRLGDKGETRGAQVKENSKEKKQERRREWNNMVGTKSTPRKKNKYIEQGIREEKLNNS